MNLLMGKLYRYSRQNRSAVSCFKECLRFANHVLRIIIQIVHFDIDTSMFSFYIFGFLIVGVSCTVASF